MFLGQIWSVLGQFGDREGNGFLGGAWGCGIVGTNFTAGHPLIFSLMSSIPQEKNTKRELYLLD